MPAELPDREEIGRVTSLIEKEALHDALMPEAAGKFLVLDLKTGDFAIDSSDRGAEAALRARRSEGTFYVFRIGGPQEPTPTGGMPDDTA